MLYLVVWINRDLRYPVQFRTFRKRADAVRFVDESPDTCNVIVVKSDLVPEFVEVDEVP